MTGAPAASFRHQNHLDRPSPSPTTNASSSSRALPLGPGIARARMLGRAAARLCRRPSTASAARRTSTSSSSSNRMVAAAAAAASPSAPGAGAAAPSSSAATTATTLETLPFDNDFARSLPADADTTNEVRLVRGALYTRVRPTPPDADDGGPAPSSAAPSSSSSPKMLAFSADAARLLGLDPQELERPEAALAFCGATLLPGSDPYATCYGGHQFGNWAAQLGDGRAIALGEVRAPPAPADVTPVPPTSLEEASAMGHVCAGAGGLFPRPGAEGAAAATGGNNNAASSSSSSSPASLFPRPDRWEVQLKGAGMTPYSRRADGRAVLRSSLRELVASEALAALGVPTTRALCLVATGQPVLRDMFYDGNARFEPGAVTTRLAPSFVRFGHFELPASRGGDQSPLVRKLADFVIRAHYPHLLDKYPVEAEASRRAFGGGKEGDEAAVQAAEAVRNVESDDEDEEKDDDGGDDGGKNAPPGSALYAAWLGEVAERTGRLAAGMQSVGFVNGVLNTDNSSILGLAIDFGPFGWLDSYDVSYTPNTTDLPGRRYAYGRQPAVLQWNVLMLANALYAAGVISRKHAEKAVAKYAPALMEAYEGWTRRKLGFFSEGRNGNDGPLAGALLEAMQQDGADFTNTWRALASVPLEPGPEEGDGPASADPNKTLSGLPRALENALATSRALSSPERAAEWRQWVSAWRAALRAEGGPAVDDAQRQALQRSASPKFVPRQHLLQEAIAAAEKGDASELERLLAVMTRPYDEQDGSDGLPAADAKYSTPPPPSFSCMLSCSS